MIYYRYFLLLNNHWSISGISCYYTIIDLLSVFPVTFQSLIYYRYFLLLYNHWSITGISHCYTIIDLLPVFPVTLQSLIYYRYFTLLYNHWSITGISCFFTIIDLWPVFHISIQSLIYYRYFLLHNRNRMTVIKNHWYFTLLSKIVPLELEVPLSFTLGIGSVNPTFWLAKSRQFLSQPLYWRHSFTQTRRELVNFRG